nr:hypothetical protein [Tanacetum cinerariifolium]
MVEEPLKMKKKDQISFDEQEARSSKRARDELDQERSKKQKVKDDKESEELKRCLKIIPDDRDDVTIDATPLSIKTLIIDYKIYKEGKKIMKIPLLEYFATVSVKEFPLLVYFAFASEEVFPLLSQRDVPTKEVCTAEKLKVNRGQRHNYISQRHVSVILGMCPMIDPMI